MPTPGSAAEKARNERLAKRGKAIPGAPAAATDGDDAGTDGTEAVAPKSGQRQQPKGKKRSKAAMTKPSAVQENVPDTDNPTT